MNLPLPSRFNGAAMRALLLTLLALSGAALVGACRTVTTVNGAVVSPDEAVPGKSEGDPKRRAAVRMQLAANYYQSGQLQIGIETAQASIELDPSNAAAHGLLGLMYMDTGQIALADASFHKALALDHESPELNNNYGWFLCQTGREKDSIAYFDRAVAVRLYASPARALQNAGMCLARIRDDARAEQYLLRALEADATSPLAKFHLAQLYLREGRLDRCDFYFELLTRSVAPNAEVLWLGARIAHAKKDAAAERTFTDQLQMRFPNSPQIDALHRGRYDE